MSLSQQDEALIWHPFTQAQTAAPAVPITHGKGAFIFDEKGNAYLDLISSWWVNLHGHGQPEIAQAIHRQALELEHVIFAGFTHRPAVDLCQALCNVLPPSLNRFFFSDNGSTAVEVALKMAWQYWQNQGQKQRQHFLSFEGAYHGDTFGAMAAGKASGFHNPFQKLLFDVNTIPYPATWIDDADITRKEKSALEALENYLENNGNETVAFIAEPLVQGAGGMRLCRPSFLEAALKMIQRYDILVIFDEVMTGFGRTGTLFACEQIATLPDIICLSKGLTGGFLPLALTVVQSKIYEGFLGNGIEQAFLHGHSYTANPLGCAAALASLQLLQTASTSGQIQLIQKIHGECLMRYRQKFSSLKAFRQLGTIAAFDVSSQPDEYGHGASQVLRNAFLEEGLLLRPLGNVIYLMPPYCISANELYTAYDKIEKVLTVLSIS
jgi:adenosylmethionine-8-amino-7-oxononanoate aminotransferase